MPGIQLFSSKPGCYQFVGSILSRMFGINNNFAAFFGGSTILILVGVALDTLQQIESHLLMRKYDGLVKSGNIKGRTSGSGLASIGAGS